MARMHTPGKGISGSAIPYSRRAPSWLKTTSEEAKELISKLAKKGLTPSQVGIVLRDSHGIGLVKNLTGNKIVRILKAQGKKQIVKSPSQGLIGTLCALFPR
jgi:small subunit ribosomal protein S13e